MTDTPETDGAERESIAAYIEAYGPDAVFPCDGYDHARKLERERDELIHAVHALKAAKGRFHTEQAANHLFAIIP